MHLAGILATVVAFFTPHQVHAADQKLEVVPNYPVHLHTGPEQSHGAVIWSHGKSRFTDNTGDRSPAYLV